MIRAFAILAGCLSFFASPPAPEPPESLEELMSWLQAIPTYPQARRQNPEASVRRHDVTIFRFDRLPWETVEFAAIASGKYAPNPHGSYAVQLPVSCHPDGAPAIESRQAWYVFVAGQLTSFDHYEIGENCEVVSSFGRSGSLEDDIDFLRYLRVRHHPVRPYGACEAIDVYERALAYAAVKRWDEARAVMGFADRTAPVTPDGRVAAAATKPQCSKTAQRLRARVRRQLEQAPAVAGPVWPGMP